MKVILKEDVVNLGRAGDVVKVADGYARNYLLPKNLVMKTTAKILKQVNDIKKMIIAEKEKKSDESKQIIKKLETIVCLYNRKSDENGHLYGSVDENDVVEFLKEKGININRNNVIMKKHIKDLGDYELDIIIGKEKGKVKISVKKEEYKENKK